MAFSGHLIKLKAANGNADELLPMKYMGIESYSATPNQRMESSANRATTGLLHRTTVEHTATKIEFETPVITNLDVAELNAMLQRHYTDALQRKIVIEYYDNETDSYKDATCYMPDVQFKIMRVDKVLNIMYYSPIRYAFIEY